MDRKTKAYQVSQHLVLELSFEILRGTFWKDSRLTVWPFEQVFEQIADKTTQKRAHRI